MGRVRRLAKNSEGLAGERLRSGVGSTSPAVAAQELTDKLSGMTPEERDAYLKSEEFQLRVRQSQSRADAAKTVLDGLVDTGAMAPSDAQGNKNGYGQFLQQYWAESAMREAGIDPSRWDPSKGVGANLHRWLRGPGGARKGSRSRPGPVRTAGRH